VKHDPLTAIEDVRKRLGAPRVNISVLWTVVVQLAADLRWMQAQLDTQNDLVRAMREQLYGQEPTYYVAPVGGSDLHGAVDPSQPTLFDDEATK